MKRNAKSTWKSLFGGMASGFVNGMLGAGGGMLAVPFLRYCGLTRKDAHANSVAVIMPLSAFSAVMYLISGNVSLTDAAPYLLPGLAGAAVGTLLLGRLPDRWLRRLFALFMIWAGVRLLFK